MSETDKRRISIRRVFAFGAVAFVGAMGVVGVSRMLEPSPAEVAASQTSKDEVTVTTSKPVMYKDKRLQEALDEIREKCAGRITIEVPQEAIVQAVSFKTDNPNCIAILSNKIKIGVLRLKGV